MPPDQTNDQGLILKKRARRRLVGAIALVLLMVIVLPQILQDRAVQTRNEAITITMPEPAAVQTHYAAAEAQQDEAGQDEAAVNAQQALESLIASKEAESKSTEQPPAQPSLPPPKIEKAKPVNVAENNPPEVKSPVAKTEQKPSEHFTVQVGVYSDIANVKRLQDQLKQAGYSTSTEKVTTAKGESIRLKAGSFTSRQAAVEALEKIKAIGMTGIVVGND